ncbi:hypothetical protein FA95DRAFT_1189152 [Auriscalpium vulgare]|uniref:Uncharacterized protein n=1 Tax=Auriscalpium vulgare TaxID=40419 RepID=A0ACB8RVU8_9AGAM|nr:hypothetical protein FA95DRAFT_1189152 [Auriscalpium vulgare]
MPALRFPSEGTQILSFFIHSFGVTILTHCISRRLASENFTSWQSVVQTSWARLCLLLVFLDSWLFLFLSGVFVFGVGLEINPSICSASIYLCIAFYATSKILIYFFLIEKVHLVWNPLTTSRFKSPVYVICFATVLTYVAVIALMLIGRIHYIRDDNTCIIGLKPYSSIPLLSYDLYINVFLNALFVWPVLRSNTRMSNPRVRRVAIRTLVASTVALTTSAANMIALTILKGEELGWVCVGSCGADVILNAVALFWATNHGESQSNGPSDRGVIEIAIKTTRSQHTPGAPPRQSGIPNSRHGDNFDFTSSPHKGAFYFPYPDEAQTPPVPSLPSPTRQGQRASMFGPMSWQKPDLVEEHDLSVRIRTSGDDGR